MSPTLPRTSAQASTYSWTMSWQFRTTGAAGVGGGALVAASDAAVRRRRDEEEVEVLQRGNKMNMGPRQVPIGGGKQDIETRLFLLLEARMRDREAHQLKFKAPQGHPTVQACQDTGKQYNEAVAANKATGGAEYLGSPHLHVFVSLMTSLQTELRNKEGAEVDAARRFIHWALAANQTDLNSVAIACRLSEMFVKKGTQPLMRLTLELKGS